MKHLSASFTKLVAVVACAFTLGSCNRAEYAMLPKTSSYHGETRVARALPASKKASTVEMVPEVAVAPAVSAPEVVTEQNAPASTAAVAPIAPKTTADVAVASSAAATTTVSAPAAAPKMTRVQRFAATKLVKKIGNISGIPQIKQQLAAAESQKVGGNLRTGIVLLLIGLLISLFSGINRIFGLIGGVIAIIGLIFIILYLLDSI
jgi:hypothetical protein